MINIIRIYSEVSVRALIVKLNINGTLKRLQTVLLNSIKLYVEKT